MLVGTKVFEIDVDVREKVDIMELFQDFLLERYARSVEPPAFGPTLTVGVPVRSELLGMANLV